MGWAVRSVKVVSLGVLALVIGGGAWLHFQPPELLRVGSGYAAKIVCSNVFIAGRGADEVLSTDVQAPGNPLLRLMRVSVDRERGHVHAALLGVFAGSDAVYRDGLGCAVAQRPDALEALRLTRQLVPAGDPSGPWPEGEVIESNPQVAKVLTDETLTGKGMRAVVVLKNGRIVGEAYGARFSKDVPLLGWSMTKTVNAVIIGRLIAENRLSLDSRDLLPQWQSDARGDITLAQLAAMESGLAFNEDYGTVADVTRMLYLEDDMAGFVASRPLDAPPGTRFSYSSGTSVLLSRLWMNRFADPAEAVAYPDRSLFAPLGMRSAVFEADAAGTFAGSSYLYATGRDWARFGLLLAHDGVWQGKRLLPEGFVGLMQAPNSQSGGRFSKMQTWLPVPGKTPLPAGTFFMRGHDGQTIAINPALDLVVVRLGLTPSRSGYDSGPLIAAIAKATEAAP
jgi:CubicO group peptidase (beta-lactamase class C family)